MDSGTTELPNSVLKRSSYFWSPVEGSRTGRVLLVQHREISDPGTGGSYAVKLYERVSPNTVLLKPETDANGYEPIAIQASTGDVLVVAELVEVLGVLP